MTSWIVVAVIKEHYITFKYIQTSFSPLIVLYAKLSWLLPAVHTPYWYHASAKKQLGIFYKTPTITFMTYSRCTLQQSTVECISSLDLFNSSIIYYVCGKKPITWILGILLTHHEHINNLTY